MGRGGAGLPRSANQTSRGAGPGGAAAAPRRVCLVYLRSEPIPAVFSSGGADRGAPGAGGPQDRPVELEAELREPQPWGTRALTPWGSACARSSSRTRGPGPSGSRRPRGRCRPCRWPRRCFDDTELDDSLLELSGSERGNSPLDYTEEEIQEILADDCREAEQHLIRETHLSQNANEESGEAESSSCSGASGSGDTSEITEEPEEPLPQEHSPVKGGAGWDGLPLQQDLDLQDLLSLSPFTVCCSDEPPGDNCLVEVEEEALEEVRDDYLEHATTAGSIILEDSSGQESLALECLGRSVPLSGLTHGRSTGDGSPTSGPGNKELPKAIVIRISRNSGTPEDAEGESPGAEQSPHSIKLSCTTVGQTGQGEKTSGKQPGKIIPVPKEEEKRAVDSKGCFFLWRQQTCLKGFARGVDLSLMVMEEYVLAKDPLKRPLGLACLLKPAPGKPVLVHQHICKQSSLCFLPDQLFWKGWWQWKRRDG
ncbi:S100P-binding protein [Pithys albifrons albifrons]|uniref:S100P-binding protein n=1 Tax=Pithys albifrons albifrons TaxID=3385563 RepID=UPI003A5CAA98